jgi:nitrogen fixation/metabolism regulation signal transduction histidine kinase
MFISQIAEKRIRRKYFEQSLLNKYKQDVNQLIEISLKTPEEAMEASIRISSLFNDPVIFAEAIYQLLINSIEHGHAEFGYHKKRELLENKIYHDELKKKLSVLQSTDKTVTIVAKKNCSKIDLTITDNGRGFIHSDYRSINVENISQPTGKGIIFCREIFGEIEYNLSGNEVKCTIYV